MEERASIEETFIWSARNTIFIQYVKSCNRIDGVALTNINANPLYEDYTFRHSDVNMKSIQEFRFYLSVAVITLDVHLSKLYWIILANKRNQARKQ